MKYIGETSKENSDTLPDGHGILFSDREIYLGVFNHGYLSNIGFMKFAEDKSYYFGDLNTGACAGYGCFCNNDRIAYRFGHEDIRKEEFSEYIRQNIRVERNERWMGRFTEMTKMHDYLE